MGIVWVSEIIIFGVNSVTVSGLIRYDSLLQNATNVIAKCDSYFITKHDRSLLQNATVITECDDFITKCDIYYKLLRTLEAIEYVKKYPTFQEKYKLHG